MLHFLLYGDQTFRIHSHIFRSVSIGLVMSVDKSKNPKNHQHKDERSGHLTRVIRSGYLLRNHWMIMTNHQIIMIVKKGNCSEDLSSKNYLVDWKCPWLDLKSWVCSYSYLARLMNRIMKAYFSKNPAIKFQYTAPPPKSLLAYDYSVQNIGDTVGELP